MIISMVRLWHHLMSQVPLLSHGQLSQIYSSHRLNIANMLQALEQPTVTSQKVTLSGESTAIIDYTSDIDVA